MHYGFRIVEDMIDGLSNWMDEKGFRTIDDFRGKSLPRVTDWKRPQPELQARGADRPETVHRLPALLHGLLGRRAPVHPSRPGERNGAGHRTPAQVEAESRRKIAVTPVARLDQGPFPTPLDRVPRVDEEECVGCNLCWLVCPVEGLHHDGADRHGFGVGELGSAVEQTGCRVE